MNINHNSLTRKRRLYFRLIWVAVMVIVLGISYNFLNYYYQKRAEKAVQEALVEPLNQHHIQVHFKKMGGAFLVRPHLTLNDFLLIGEGIQLKSKKINLAFTYSSLWQQMGIKTIEVEGGHWQISSEKGHALWLLIKNLPKHLLPSELHLKNNEIAFPYHGKNWHLTKSDFRLQIAGSTSAFFTLKTWISPLKGKPWPVLGSGYLSLQQNQLKGEQIEFKFPYSFIGHSLKNTLNFSFLWDKNSQEVHIKPLMLEGHQEKANLNYHLRLDKLIWQNKGSLLRIPKVSGDFSAKKGLNKINGYGVFLDFGCNDKSCGSDNGHFALKREKNYTSWVSEGDGSAYYQIDTGSFLLHEVRLNSKLLGVEKSRPYWSLNVLSELLFRPSQKIIAKAEGTFNRQALTLAVEKNLHDKNQSWQAQVYLKAFDLFNYRHQDHSVLTLKEHYNQLLRQVPLLFSVLKDHNLWAYFKVGELHFLHVDFSNLQGLFLHQEQKIALENVRGQFFEGEFAGNLTITEKQGYHYHVEQHLKHLNIGLMLYYLAGYPFLSGEGNAYLSLEGKGSTVEEVLSSLSGFSTVDIDQGLLLNANLGHLFNDANKINLLELIKETYPHTRNTESKKMPFNNLKFVSYWNNGISDTLFLAINGPEFNVRGSGSTNLKQYLLDYSLILTGDVMEEGKTIRVTLPILLTGSLLNPRYRLDYKRLEELFNASANKGVFLKELLRRQWNLLH